VGANCKFNNYTTNDQLQAWHLPSLTYALSGQYYVNKNLVAQVGLDGMSRRYNTIQYTGQQIEMKGFTDINLRVDYKVKNLLRIWVQGSNLLNQKYQQWYGYNNFGLTVMGGISAGF
jgi:outer membrane cobalamin receptor